MRGGRRCPSPATVCYDARAGDLRGDHEQVLSHDYRCSGHRFLFGPEHGWRQLHLQDYDLLSRPSAAFRRVFAPRHRQTVQKPRRMFTHRRFLEREQPNGPTYLLQLLPRLIELQLSQIFAREPACRLSGATQPSGWPRTTLRSESSLQRLRQLRDVSGDPPGSLLLFRGAAAYAKCVMTDDLNRTCPHCGGKNTSYFYWY
jgi:hypothetical protein